MKFNSLVEEIYDTNTNKNYPASSSAPRKDFAPVSTKDGYHYPYQNTGASEMENPLPDTPITHPWELQTVSDDLSNSFISLIAASQKIISSKNNPALDLKQKQELNKILKYSRKILNAIKNVAFKIDDIANIAVEKTPEIKMNASQNNNPSHLKRTEVAIKLPN
jgi:hypothetical protein